MEIFLVGVLYDDFAEGGFEILFASENKQKSIEVLKEKRKDSENSTPFFGHRPIYGMRVLKTNEKNEEKVIKRLDI